MLAQTLSTDATPTPFNINSFISSLADDEGYLVNGDSAQFASGYLYAGSDQLVDKRDYIVGCTKHNDELDQILEDAFAAFNKNDMKTGTKKIQESGDPFNKSMASCDETNDYFATMGAEDAAFFNSKDWDKTLEKNYKENKDYVD